MSSRKTVVSLTTATPNGSRGNNLTKQPRVKKPKPVAEKPMPGGDVDQATICSVHCAARCCNYVTIHIDRPNSEVDWDEVRWWVLHEGISVVKDEDGWMVIVETRCRNLLPTNLCEAHPYHPITCNDYDASHCEYTGPVEFEACLNCEDDLAGYIETRKLRRGAKVAIAIRESQRQLEKKRAEQEVPSYAGGLLPILAEADIKK